MRRHDSIFKKLLREFFPDLLRLVVPDLLARLDLERLVETTRERVEAISSLERLNRLGRRVLTARSLAALRLG